MSVQDPHKPCHEATEFWYSFEHRALLYDVEVDDRPRHVRAVHSRFEQQTHAIQRVYPRHHDPHGFKFTNPDMNEDQLEASLVNVELIVRLFADHLCESDPEKSSWDKTVLFPVPKPLALFLEAKKAEMYKDECLSQAILLLQAYMLSKAH